LRDVDELAATPEVVGNHLELADLADGLAARGDRDVLVGGGRRSHPAEGDRRTADDHRLGGGGAHGARICGSTRGRLGRWTLASGATARTGTAARTGLHARTRRARTALDSLRSAAGRDAGACTGSGAGADGGPGAGTHPLRGWLGD